MPSSGATWRKAICIEIQSVFHLSLVLELLARQVSGAVLLAKLLKRRGVVLFRQDGAALKKSKSGAVIGGGTGLRYSYIDLALSDSRKGIEQIVKVLRNGKMVKRTWILFFDDSYEYEWIGIWDDSPPPPGMK